MDGSLVGTCIGLDYGGFGWIAMMLVDPVHRRLGLGAALLARAIAALPQEAPIRLDATPLGRPLYAQHVFTDECALTRFVANPHLFTRGDMLFVKFGPLTGLAFSATLNAPVPETRFGVFRM